MTRITLSSSLFLGAWLTAAVLPAQIDTITEKRVLEAVSWLADDARAGRDTPSPGLEESAQWLAKRFEAAGLQQITKGTWFADYTLPGSSLDSKDVELKLVRTLGDKKSDFTLQPDVDVRLWRPADCLSGENEATTVAQMDDPVLQRLLMSDSARRPIVIEVPDSHPYWIAAGGAHLMLGTPRAAARPIFLVRKGVFPAMPAVVSENNEPLWTAVWKAPAPEKIAVPLKNVVAWLPGTSKREEYVVVSAHYDHIGMTGAVNGDFINNGADDDASGTTAVLLLAEAMAKEPPPARSILFVCFSGEEKGLRGSKAFAEHPPVPREQIVADINIEMIGRPEEGKQGMAWITGVEYSDFATITGGALKKAGVELTEFGMARRLFAQSDNYSFAKYGIVAHSLSAGSLHKDYHRPSDEVSKLDIPHMTKIVRGLYWTVREFAERDAKPGWTEAGKKVVEQLHR